MVGQPVQRGETCYYIGRNDKYALYRTAGVFTDGMFTNGIYGNRGGLSHQGW